MTILTGIICPDSIVLAADSRMTDFSTGATSQVDKITVIHFAVDDVLISQSGSLSVTNRILQIIQDKAPIKITRENVVIQMIEDAIRRNHNAGNRWPSTSLTKN